MQDVIIDKSHPLGLRSLSISIVDTGKESGLLVKKHIRELRLSGCLTGRVNTAFWHFGKKIGKLHLFAEERDPRSGGEERGEPGGSNRASRGMRLVGCVLLWSAAMAAPGLKPSTKEKVAHITATGGSCPACRIAIIVPPPPVFSTRTSGQLGAISKSTSPGCA